MLALNDVAWANAYSRVVTLDTVLVESIRDVASGVVKSDVRHAAVVVLHPKLQEKT